MGCSSFFAFSNALLVFSDFVATLLKSRGYWYIFVFANHSAYWNDKKTAKAVKSDQKQLKK